MNLITNALKGMAMGIAEVIPGVSGGTIALITGIYPKLIETITSFNLELIRSTFKDGWKGIKAHIDIRFLISLITGMALGLLVGIFAITYLYENYPEPLWGFFFGLILASSIYIARSIKEWKWKDGLILLIGIAIAFGITIISPASGSSSYIYIFVSGMLAITALILPGISGSFILLLLGMYTVIIPTLKGVITDFSSEGFLVILVFASGCLLGIIGFSRVLKYLFAHYERNTMILLTGFMIGSLNKIWPWRNASTIVDKITGDRMAANPKDLAALDPDSYKILVEQNVLPQDYWMSDPLIAATILSLILGLLSIGVFSLVQNK
jgi:putative membrane protein